jgi:hypothetical protein
VLEVPKPLLSLLSSLSGVDQIIESGGAIYNVDYYCPLMSLPYAFKTTVETIPFPDRYLQSASAKIKYWNERLQPFKRLKIGLVWNGGTRPDRLDLSNVNSRRNIKFSLFASAFNTIDADFFSLQKGEPAESEIKGHELIFFPEGNFHNYTKELLDFSDTAALIENLDLVIGVDTSTIHLSAGLGKPTWILNRFDNCWRWLVDREDSPWYHSAKLYRQHAVAQWEPILDKIAIDIRRLICQKDY